MQQPERLSTDLIVPFIRFDKPGVRRGYISDLKNDTVEDEWIRFLNSPDSTFGFRRLGHAAATILEYLERADDSRKFIFTELHEDVINISRSFRRDEFFLAIKIPRTKRLMVQYYNVSLIDAHSFLTINMCDICFKHLQKPNEAATPELQSKLCELKMKMAGYAKRYFPTVQVNTTLPDLKNYCGLCHSPLYYLVSNIW